MLKVFAMNVYPDKATEYIRRHNPIWPELEQTLRDHGVSNYRIHLDHNTGMLFATAEIESEERWTAIADTDVCQRWWAYNAELMETNEDNSPIAVNLTQIFHLP